MTEPCYAVTDPATNTVVARYPAATDEQIAAAVRDADAAFGTWRRVADRLRAGR